jgi:hypothetical protein
MSIREREIRASYGPTSVRVYQAYSNEIADSAVQHQTFVSPPFSMTRMTWIKPSFLWMMYRSGWAQKDEGQVRILAIDISHEGLRWALDNACPSHPTPGMDHDDWKRRLEAAPVRIQWDPERDLALAALPHRTIQIGLSGEAVRRYAKDWIEKITDVTPLAKDVHERVLDGDLEAAKSKLPVEEPYLFDDGVNWHHSRAVVREFGFPPRPELLAELRKRIDKEIANLEFGGPHEYLRSLCALLWSNGDPSDVVQIARAKFIDFDAMCMVDSDFLLFGDPDATEAFLKVSTHPAAKSALEFLRNGADFTPEALSQRIAAERDWLMS